MNSGSIACWISHRFVAKYLHVNSPSSRLFLFAKSMSYLISPLHLNAFTTGESARLTKGAFYLRTRCRWLPFTYHFSCFNYVNIACNMFLFQPVPSLPLSGHVCKSSKALSREQPPHAPSTSLAWRDPFTSVTPPFLFTTDNQPLIIFILIAHFSTVARFVGTFFAFRCTVYTNIYIYIYIFAQYPMYVDFFEFSSYG
ncbi:hypothetical protein TB927.1.3610 [Trypanosoma brucei brucei TREU927]|uniref:T. brucei spp.-specific protein n=1 Tax=Trypanosoma brucei brucei (strain 927/4 GUTat10.1) TaxID=185431 RepID=Q4GYL2_TRYB2|nr:hypothetical protein TB927.1.3610 [Trypanosoma brucei brucei TREU927]CAJ16572.1 hypothetical protein TB927.1.3610 [Trypanosoma brucei brucei TREU927]